VDDLNLLLRSEVKSQVNNEISCVRYREDRSDDKGRREDDPYLLSSPKVKFVVKVVVQRSICFDSV